MNKEKTEPILIGIKEACELTGIGRNTMLDVVKLDNFPSVKFKKRKILINRQQLIEWVNNLTSTPEVL